MGTLVLVKDYKSTKTIYFSLSNDRFFFYLFKKIIIIQFRIGIHWAPGDATGNSFIRLFAPKSSQRNR